MRRERRGGRAKKDSIRVCGCVCVTLFSSSYRRRRSCGTRLTQNIVLSGRPSAAVGRCTRRRYFISTTDTPPTPVRPKSDNNSYWSGRVRSLEITKVRAHTHILTHTHTNNSIHFFSRSLHTTRPFAYLPTHTQHTNTLISYIDIYINILYYIYALFFPLPTGRGGRVEHGGGCCSGLR